MERYLKYFIDHLKIERGLSRNTQTAYRTDLCALGDYFMENGRPRRKRSEETKAPFVYAGAQILNPRIFDQAPDGKFSLNLLYNTAEKEGRLAAVIGDGDWYHVGTPEALALAEQRLKDQPHDR